MNDVQKKIALRRLLQQKLTEAPRDLVPEDWVAGEDMDMYHQMASDTTKNNAQNLRNNIAESLPPDSEDMQPMYEDLANQRAADNLRYSKLKELLNKK